MIGDLFRVDLKNMSRLALGITVLCMHGALAPALAQELHTEKPKPPVKARLIAKQSIYTLPKARHGAAFRKRIEEETDSDRLPAPPRVDLVLELTNVSKEAVMIWPRGSIAAAELTIEGPGAIGPENLMTVSGESAGTSVQPTIAPGKSHRIEIKSLNPGGGTPFDFWCEPGEYTIEASYVVYTGLPPFPFPGPEKPAKEPQRFVVTTPPVKVKVILEGDGV